MATILVGGELSGAVVAPITLELIAAARSVAGSGDQVAVAFAGEPGIAASDVPADRVYLIESDALGDRDAGVFDAATAALQQLAAETAPSVIIFARTDSGSVIAPRLAHRLGSALARDCTGIERMADGSIAVTRPVHGGAAVGKFQFTGAGPHIISARPGAFDPAQTAEAAPDVVQFNADLPAERRAVLIGAVQERKQGVRLEDAEVVVSGGRGLGGPEPFKQLEELADLLHGAVGASRAACDAGWIDHSHQVGLTGKSISPRLYLTFGISGASQHMAGCSAAKNIVAVNTDGDANIFKEARFGVVGDWSKVLPAFIATLRDIG
jgi:electron transfer flavoprotein alpha subunit